MQVAIEKSSPNNYTKNVLWILANINLANHKVIFTSY